MLEKVGVQQGWNTREVFMNNISWSRVSLVLKWKNVAFVIPPYSNGRK